MARRRRRRARATRNGAVHPDRLSPIVDEDPDLIQVVIETPKGSRNKYAFDPALHLFALKKVLPAGMAFPYDFGFVPSTLAEDGDPLDVLVLMDEPAFAGCLLRCRLIGLIEGEQQVSDKRKAVVRNDRVVAVEVKNHSFKEIRRLDDLGDKFCEELEQFFVNYHELSGEKFRVIGDKGPKAARKKIQDCRR